MNCSERPRPRFVISNVSFSHAAEWRRSTGLLGWVTFILDGCLAVDGVAVRRTTFGLLTLSFPARTDAGGRRHPIVRPLDEETRRDIESQVFSSLGIGQEEVG